MTTENPATVEELREALQFAIKELFEAGDKMNVIHHNHPSDYGFKNKQTLAAQHQREDKEHLAHWSDRAFNAAEEIKKVLAK